MTGKGFFIDKLSGACFAKSFGCSSICFYLWHLFFSLMLRLSNFAVFDFCKNRWREQSRIPSHAT
jgi:hypothetical protein